MSVKILWGKTKQKKLFFTDKRLLFIFCFFMSEIYQRFFVKDKICYKKNPDFKNVQLFYKKINISHPSIYRNGKLFELKFEKN